MLTGIVAVALSVLALVVQRRDGWSPLSMGLLLWAVISLGLWWNPLHLIPLSLPVYGMLLLGVFALAFPALVSAAPDRERPSTDESLPVASQRLLIATIAAAILSIIGAYVFRSQIAASSGSSFGDLTTQQVRYYQNQKMNSSGLLSLFQACYPILGALGIVGFLRISRWYSAAIVLAVALSLQNPGRLFTVSLIVQVSIMYAYIQRRRGATPRKKTSRARIYLLAATGLAASLFVFIWLGDKLGKNQMTTDAVQTSLPDPLVSPMLYLTGGLPAITSALASGDAPFEGRGSSAFIIVRVWHALTIQGPMPATVGNFVDNPYSFNVFTGFGQAYWDGGYLWVVALSLALGALAVWSHRHALRGSLIAMWASSIVGMLLISLPMQHRLLNLDTLFQLALGAVLMRFVIDRSALPREAGGVPTEGAAAEPKVRLRRGSQRGPSGGTKRIASTRNGRRNRPARSRNRGRSSAQRRSTASRH